MDRPEGSVTYTVTFTREAAGLNFSALALTSVYLVPASDQTVSFNTAVLPRTVATGIIQTLKLAATGGNYQLHFVRDRASTT